jgi:PilZ domain-containing protein
LLAAGGPLLSHSRGVRSSPVQSDERAAAMTNNLHQPGEETIAEFFAKTGHVPVSWDDDGCFPHFYYRSCAEATIYPLNGEGEPTNCFLVTCDISQCGVSVLLHQQVFSGQRLDLVLNGEAPRPVTVLWCRRVKDGRYLTGCRFVKCAPG